MTADQANTAPSTEEEARTLLAAIVESSDDAILSKSLDAIVTSWNRAAERMYGYTAEEIIGRPITILAPPDRPHEIPRIMAQIRQGQRVSRLETVRVRKDGERIDVAITVSPVRDSTGRIVGASTIARDITGYRQAERQRAELLDRERIARRRAEDAEHRLAFLAQASNVLASSLDYEATLAAVSRLAVPHIADWCAVYIREDGGEVRLLDVAHVDPARVRLARELTERYPYDPDATTGVPNVIRTRQSELISELTGDLLGEAPDPDILDIVRELQLHSFMTVPLVARGRVLGAISFVGAESGRRFTADDLALAEDLAHRAALAVDNARLFRDSSQTAAQQAAILEHMADGVLMLDVDSRVTYMNQVARSLLGIGGTGMSLHDLIVATQSTLPTGESLSEEETALAHALRGEVVLNAERRLRAVGSGESRTIHLSVSPVTTGDGVAVGAVAVLHDVTAERDLEHQKDAFLAAAAHDLKTPLTTIKGTAQVMQRRLDRGDYQRLADGLAQIDSTTTRMARLVNELVDISRLQMGGTLELHLMPDDLYAAIRHVVAEAQRATDRHRITLATDLTTLAGLWDAERLERVLDNLLSNATKYSPEGGEIEVSVSCQPAPKGSEAVITVRDEGIGIPSQDLPHIFERFYRAGNVTQGIPGTGIGLVGVKQIVEQHGGTITVDSREGQGSTFTISLPIVSRLPEAHGQID